MYFFYPSSLSFIHSTLLFPVCLFHWACSTERYTCLELADVPVTLSPPTPISLEFDYSCSLAAVYSLSLDVSFSQQLQSFIFPVSQAPFNHIGHHAAAAAFLASVPRWPSYSTGHKRLQRRREYQEHSSTQDDFSRMRKCPSDR